MTKRIIQDVDGNPVEIEIDDTKPEDRLTWDEYLQAMLLARQILRGEIKPPRILPGHENRYKRKKKQGG